MDDSILNQSFFSAKTMEEDLLQAYYDRIAKILNPQNVDGRTVGLDYATARLEMKEVLQDLGINPDEDTAGTLIDLTSDARINLVLETNVQMAQGVGAFVQGNDPAVVEAFPCWEFIRFENRKEPRDWPKRWRQAATEARDADAILCLEQSGRMVACKDSGIWQALGDGAGGYSDTLGNPFPPFAFRSGMWVQDVSWEESKQLGLVEDGDKITPQKIDYSDAFGTSEQERAA